MKNLTIMTRPPIRRVAAFAGLLLSVFIACHEPTGSESGSLRNDGGDSPKAIPCPVNASTSASGVLGPLGGAVTALPTATAILLPAGALLTPTTFDVTVPASQFVIVDIKADGADHFTFALPVTIVLDYSRCTRSDILGADLGVYVYEPATGELGEKMVSVDNKLLRQITFATNHLTSYVVAE
jgi:hypothetical protein